MRTRPLFAEIGEACRHDVLEAAGLIHRRLAKGEVSERFTPPAGNRPARSPSHLRLTGAGITVAVSRFLGAPWGADGEPVPSPRTLAAMIHDLASRRDPDGGRTTIAAVRRDAHVEMLRDASCILDAIDPEWRANASRMAVECGCTADQWGFNVGYENDQLGPIISIATVADREDVGLSDFQKAVLVSRWPVIMTDRELPNGEGWLIEPSTTDGTQLIDLHDYPEEPISQIARHRAITSLLAQEGTQP